MPVSSYRDFREQFDLSPQAVYASFFERNRDQIPALREQAAIARLQRIIDATFHISNRSGFQGMGLRDLSREVDMSLGALYRYISSKEALARMILEHTQAVALGVLGDTRVTALPGAARLAEILRLHVYVSEDLQPWFYFSFMEAKVLPPAARRTALEGEQATEDLIHDAIAAGQSDGAFKPALEPRLAAAMLKGLLQDWYLKRGKYRRREQPVDAYADAVVDCARAYLRPQT